MIKNKAVFVVGAGATFNEAKEAKANDLPPLDKDFFIKYKVNQIVSASKIQEYLKSTYNINIYDEEYNSLEKIMVILYSDSFRSHQSFSQFQSLIRLLNHRLAVSTLNLCPDPKGTFYLIIKEYLKRYDPNNITFITFNQDIQIEKLLDKLSSDDDEIKNNLLNFPYCYHLPETIPIKKINSSHKKQKKSYFSKGSIDDEGVKILKLHGSLNWYSLHSRKNPKRTALFNPNRKMYLYTNKSLYPTVIHQGIQRKYQSFPIIIPPVILKSQIFHNNLDIIWKEAEKRLTDATEIVTFGYSFPASDYESTNLFKRALKVNQNDFRLSIIDPDPSVVVKLANIAETGQINWYKSSFQYLKTIAL